MPSPDTVEAAREAQKRKRAARAIKKIAPGLAKATKPVPRGLAHRMAMEDAKARAPRVPRLEANPTKTPPNTKAELEAKTKAATAAQIFGAPGVTKGTSLGKTVKAATQTASPLLTRPLAKTGKTLAAFSGAQDVLGVAELAAHPFRSVEQAQNRPITNKALVDQAIQTLGATAGRPGAPKETPLPEGAEAVNRAMDNAKRLRSKQDAIHKVERAEKIAKAEEAYKTGGLKAKFAALKGPMEKVEYKGLADLDQPAFDALTHHVETHPALSRWDRVSAQAGLRRAQQGIMPQPSQMEKIIIAFGPQRATSLIHHIAGEEGAAHYISQVWNLPRSLRSTLDISAPLRQGLVVAARHPKLWTRNFREMTRMAKSEDHYQATTDKILARPNALNGKYKKAKIAFTDLGSKITGREEQFPAGMAEKIPVVGHAVRFSGRAYTGFLNKTRADMFDMLLKKAERKGYNINDEKLLKDLGKYVNAATGRGHFGRADQTLSALNTVFFSPRLFASRANILNPVGYLPHPGFNKHIAAVHPFVRGEAWKARGALAAAIGGTLGVGAVAGGKVELDPRNANFAKIQLGDTRIDPSGGFQQFIRAGAQIGSGKTISSTTGKVATLDGGFGKKSRWDITRDFVESKYSPQVAELKQVLGGNKFQKTSPQQVVGSLTVPLSLQDAYDTATNGAGPKALLDPTNLAKGGLAYAGAGTGLGVQTYSAPDAGKKARGKVFEKRQEFYDQAKKLGMVGKDGRLGPTTRAAFNLEADRQARYGAASAKYESASTDYQHARYGVDIAILTKYKWIHPDEGKKMLVWAKTASRDDLKKAREAISQQFYQGPNGQLAWINQVRHEIEDAGGKIKQ